MLNFNIVSNDHAKNDFCVSVCKTNFTDHYTPDTVHGLVETRFWSVKCTTVTVQYAKISRTSIPSHQAMPAIAMVRLYKDKPLQKLI